MEPRLSGMSGSRGALGSCVRPAYRGLVSSRRLLCLAAFVCPTIDLVTRITLVLGRV